MTNGPAEPSLNGPHGIGVRLDFDNRRQNRKKIGKKYEMYNPSAGSEMNALNAVLLPMLINASRQRHVASRTRLLRGSRSLGCTRPKTVEKGSPLSREKAQSNLETEAKTLKNATINMIASMEMKKFVARLEPVAW